MTNNNKIKCIMFSGVSRKDIETKCNQFLENKKFVQATQSEHGKYDPLPIRNRWKMTVTIWYKENN